MELFLAINYRDIVLLELMVPMTYFQVASQKQTVEYTYSLAEVSTSQFHKIINTQRKK